MKYFLVLICLLIIVGSLFPATIVQGETTGKWLRTSNPNIPPSTSLKADAPSTILDIKMIFETTPLLGENARLVCSVESELGAPETQVNVELPGGVALVSGDLSWHGDIPAGGKTKIKAMVKAVQAGNWTIHAEAKSRKHPLFHDVEEVHVFVLETATYIGESPFAPLSVRVEAPPIVEEPLLHQGIVPEAPHPSEPSSPGTLTVTGRFYNYISQDSISGHTSDTEQPMCWGCVWIYRASDNDYLNGDITGPRSDLPGEGYFSIPIENPGANGFYVVMLPYTTACRVVRPDDSDYTSWTPDFYPSSSATNYDIGAWRPPDQWDYMGAWRIYESIAQDHYDRGAWDFMANEGPGYTPPAVLVHFKMPSGTGTHIHMTPDSGVIDIDTDAYSKALDIAQHEYGHWVMYKAYGNYWPPGATGSHSINRISNAPLAWTEGWADAFPLICQSYGRWEDSYFEWGTGLEYDLETCPDCDPGDQCEGRVAGALWDVFDAHEDGHDYFDVSLPWHTPNNFLHIWDVVSSQTDDNYLQFYQAWRAKGKDRHLLNYCSYQNTIDYDNSPDLTNGDVTPSSGYPNTNFGFYVTYQDVDWDPPGPTSVSSIRSYSNPNGYIRLYVYDGGWTYYAMNHYSGNPESTETFYKELSGFSVGDHNYYFLAYDGITGGEDRYPDSGYRTFQVAPYTVHLESMQDNGATANLGTITFDGTSYSLPDDVSKAAGTYSAEYFADVGYVFDHWETSGAVFVSSSSDNPTTVTVSGDGTLKAVYRMKNQPPSIVDIYPDSETVYQGDTIRIYCDSNDPETPESGLTCNIWIRPSGGSWVVSGETMSWDGSDHYYDWNISTTATLGYNDVKCTVSDGELSDERTDYNEFQVLETYDVTMKAHCNSEGVDVSVSFTWNGTPYATLKTFINQTGSREVIIDERDANGHPFVKWLKDGIDYSTNRTITVSTNGTYTAIYEAISISAFTTCDEDGNAKTTFQRTETVYVCFTATYPDGSSVTTGSATVKIQLSTDDGVTWINKTTLTAIYNAGKGKWFTAVGYKIAKDEPHISAPMSLIHWRALLPANALDDASGNKGPFPQIAFNFSVDKADLDIVITDGMIPSQTYQRTLTTATVKFTITYPDGSHFPASDLGQITVTITDGINNYTLKLSASDYDNVTKKWSASWLIPKDAALSTGYKFMVVADDVFDSVSPNPNSGPPVDISDVNTFSVVKADLIVTIVNQPATSYSRGQNATFDIRIQYPDLSNFTVTDVGTTGIIEARVYFNETLMATIRIDSTNASTHWRDSFNGFTICWYIPPDAPLSTPIIKYKFKIEQDGIQDTVITPNTGPASPLSSDSFDVIEVPQLVISVEDQPYASYVLVNITVWSNQEYINASIQAEFLWNGTPIGHVSDSTDIYIGSNTFNLTWDSLDAPISMIGENVTVLVTIKSSDDLTLFSGEATFVLTQPNKELLWQRLTELILAWPNAPPEEKDESWGKIVKIVTLYPTAP